MPPAKIYKETINELFDLQKFAIKLGLHNISELSKLLNDPHLSYPVIHIAGTNGKGSTAFHISNFLQACGLKVGLYTSPHLVDYRERIRVNNKIIDAQSVIRFWHKVKLKVLELKATFFDTTTLMAFNYFAEQKVDVAVFETGLGGRLDSTNIIKPDSIVITPISFDHQQHLGSTLKKIATEKAGIIKPNSDVYLAKMHQNALNVVLSATDPTNNVYELNDYIKTQLVSADIQGIHFKIRDLVSRKDHSFYFSGPAEYQIKNIALAYLVSTNFCKKNSFEFNANHARDIIAKNAWPGRLQLIRKNPNIIFDVSHNLSGIKETLRSVLRFTSPGKTVLLLGIVNDKDVYGITKYLSQKFKKIIVTEPHTYRKQKGEVLFKAFKESKENVELIKDIKSAYQKGQRLLDPDETLLAIGSHYLIGALILS